MTAFFSKITRGEWVNPGHDNSNVKTTSTPLKMKPNLLRIDAKIKVIIIQVLSHMNMTWHVTPSPPLTTKPNLFSHQGHDNLGVVTPSPPLHVRTTPTSSPIKDMNTYFYISSDSFVLFRGRGNILHNPKSTVWKAGCGFDCLKGRAGLMNS